MPQSFASACVESNSASLSCDCLVHRFGIAARTRVLNADAFPTTAAAIAAVLIDNAIPATVGDDRRREEVPS